MNTRGSRLIGGWATALLVVVLAAPVHAADRQFTLAGAVPNDVFLCVAAQHNPERDFLREYWGEVLDALRQCGVGEDLLELIGSSLETEQKAEVERLKERASQLLAGVDWKELAGKEMVFAERFGSPGQGPGGRMLVGPPDMVWLFRGSSEGAARNYDGLVAILEAVVEEVNKAVGSEVLLVDRTPRMGAKLTGVNLLASIPGAPRLPISVALRDDVVLMALGEQILTDVLGLLDGSGSRKALADDPRYKAAFAQLPPAEDSMVFFDMQALLGSLRALVDMGIAASGLPGDVYRNRGISAEADELTGRATVAYQRGDIKQALALTKQAHEVAPNDSTALYNLACFNALLGNREAALTWLAKAVDGGFQAPRKISSDSDLVSLRADPRYEATLARAAELAAQRLAEDVILNSTKSGEVHELNTQAWKAYEEQDYEQGLKAVQQAYELAPKDSRVLYYLACFHALLGHEDQALDFLQKAAEGGFYCPRHISEDPDLESIRHDQRYQAALAEATRNAAKVGAQRAAEKAAMVKRLVDRLMNAVGILDYAATVESTDGYSVRTESVAVLVPDAKDRPIYPVFGTGDQLTDFDRFLPQETASFSVGGGLDLGQLYKFLEDSVRVAGPEGEGLLAKWAAIQEEFGIDVKKDVIGWIDDEFVSVTLAEGGGSVWLIEVTDEEVAREKVAGAVEFLSTKLTELMAKNPALGMLGVHTSPTQHERLEGFANLHFAVSPQPIVWGVADGHLVFGSSAEAVAMCLDTARGRHPGIRENRRVMSEALLPKGPFTSVTLTDQRSLGEELAAGIGVVSMVSGMLTMVIPDPEVRPVVSKIAGMLAKLTPVVSKIDFYKSTATCTTFDGQTWRTRMITHYVSPAERAGSEIP